MVDQKKFQMYVNPETDPKLYQFIESIEKGAPNKKGYVVDQIKEILRAWSGLMDIYGERDVLLLSMQLAAGNPPKPSETAPLIVGEREEVKPEVGTSAPIRLKGASSMYRKNKKATPS
jgi:hypothetical protein